MHLSETSIGRQRESLKRVKRVC